MKALRLLAVSLACVALTGCPPEKEDCPDAQDLYDYAWDVHQTLLSAVPFKTEWEAIVRQNEQRRPGLTDALLPIWASYDLGQEIEIRTKLRLRIPESPKPLSCGEVKRFRDAAGDEARAAIQFYYLAVLGAWGKMPECRAFAPVGLEDLFCGQEWGIEVSGSAESTWSDGGNLEYSACTPTPFALLCCQPSSCPLTEEKGCTGQQSHQVTGLMGVSYDPEAPSPTAELTFVEFEAVPGLKLATTQPREFCDFPPKGDAQACFLACVEAGSASPCCIDQCMNYVAEPVQDTIDCNLAPRWVPDDFTLPLKEGTHPLRAETSGRTTQTADASMRCARGCECSQDSDCDDGRVCTRDACQDGNCTSMPDDTIRPEQAPGDCRRCENGEVHSVREAFEQECRRLRADGLRACARPTDNWIVHWVEESPAGQDQWHFCLAGESPASADEPVCAGAGQCASGQPTTSVTGHYNTACQSLDGQELEFVCDVLCTVCR